MATLSLLFTADNAVMTQPRQKNKQTTTTTTLETHLQQFFPLSFFYVLSSNSSSL
jgi:hypothetical protein